MIQFKSPGVYTQELPSGVQTINGAPTSTTLFVGPTRSGIDNRPIRIQSFGDFERHFGGLSQNSSLSYSVLHFFANGGGDAFVLRVPTKNSAPAASGFKQDDGGNNLALTLTALSSGLNGSGLFIEFDAFGIGARPFDTTPDKKRFNLTITDKITGRVERFTNLSTASASARFAPSVINDPATGSKLVRLTMGGIGEEAPQCSGTVYKIGAAPAAGTFASDVNLALSVELRAADGTVDSANSISNLAVPVFANGSAHPTTALELVTKVTNAINTAIRADPAAAAKLQGVAVEGSLFEGGTLIRLRVASPGPDNLRGRVNDARVTISDPATGTSLLVTYAITLGVSNPSRYQLGALYASSQLFGSPTPGADGDASGQPDTTVFKQAVMDLDAPDPFFNLLCLPDLVRPTQSDPTALQHASAMSIYAEAARICQNKHAFLLIDPLPNVVDVGSAEAWKSTGFTFQSNHSAAYFPNIRVDDPLEPGAIRSHPPSGAIAGIIARTDGQVGVWQSPAGTDAALAGVYGPSVVLSDAEHGLLNPLGLNVIRQFPIFGTVSFGSRTVDGADAMASDWKYIAVRRMASYLLRSLSEALRWAVHKPNGEQLWSQLRVSITAFMQGLFRQGAFKGVSAREAYFVQCDGTTTTPDDISHGVVNIVIGFAPLKPAEFVVISLRQIVQPSN